VDKLDRIFALQKSFNDELVERRGLQDIPMEKWLQMQTLATISELSELLDEVNFKWWKNPKPVDEGALREELVDILHFFVSMCLSAGMSADELFERYLKKNRENFDRQHGASDKPGYALPSGRPEP
jgi:dimeric dUTPase (all-alpha-NTP-PPase superfamily)